MRFKIIFSLLILSPALSSAKMSPRQMKFAPIQAVLVSRDIPALLGKDLLKLGPLLSNISVMDVTTDFGARASKPYEEELDVILREVRMPSEADAVLVIAAAAAIRAAKTVRQSASLMAQDMREGRIIPRDTATLDYADDLLLFNGMYLTSNGAAELQGQVRRLRGLTRQNILRSGHAISTTLSGR